MTEGPRSAVDVHGRLGCLAIVPYPSGRVGSQRYRIEQWAPRLRAAGIELTIAPFFSNRMMDVLYQRGHVLLKVRETIAGYIRRTAQRRVIARHVALVHREAFPVGPSWLDQRLVGKAPFVYDFDDAIFLPSTSASNRWIGALKNPAKTARLCRAATHVTPGNEYLAEYARRHSSSVTVIPTTIDTDEYVCRPRAPNARPVVGWTGSATTVPYLMALQAPLRALRRRVPFELRVIGAEVSMPGLDVACVPWRAATEVEDLRPLDVGLMPLPDDPWTRGKCGFKALQYMALGIPPVVSPVGVNPDIVHDGHNGFLACSDAEWIEKISALLASPDRRAAFGVAARQTVEQRYSARVHAPRVAAILRAAAGAPA